MIQATCSICDYCEAKATGIGYSCTHRETKQFDPPITDVRLNTPACTKFFPRQLPAESSAPPQRRFSERAVIKWASIILTILAVVGLILYKLADLVHVVQSLFKG